jgi:hypothetical protein
MAELPDRDRLAVVRAAPRMTTRAGRPVTILSVRRTIGQVPLLIDRQQWAGAIRGDPRPYCADWLAIAPRSALVLLK